MKSDETNSSSVNDRNPFIYDADASFNFLSMSSMEVSFSAVKVRSTTETSGVGTRNAMPVSFPFVDGSTSPTALAAPVADGMMLQAAARPPRQSLADTPSTVFLRRSVGVNGRHQALLNSNTFLQKHVHNRGKAIGRTRRIGHNVMRPP